MSQRIFSCVGAQLLARRGFLLSCGYVLTAAATLGERVRLRPDAAPAVVAMEPAAGNVARIWVGGCGEPVELPATRARLLPTLPIAGRDLLAVAFGADLPGLCTQDLAALIGWDGVRLRILGLETCSWQRGDGAQFTMHLSGSPDRQHLSLGCLAALGRPVTLPFRLVWTDWLRWQDRAPLADARSGAAMAGSWPAESAAVRRRITDLLATPTTSLTLDGLAGTGILNQFSCMADR